MHANQPYRWEYVTEKQGTSSGAIKQKYEAELKKKLTAEELVNVLERDVENNNKIALQRVDTVSRCIQRLDAIALRPNPFSTPQNIDLIIDAEQQKKRLGFKERIESLKKLRQMAVITSKVRNNESLLTTDRKDDAESTDDQKIPKFMEMFFVVFSFSWVFGIQRMDLADDSEFEGAASNCRK